MSILNQIGRAMYAAGGGDIAALDRMRSDQAKNQFDMAAKYSEMKQKADQWTTEQQMKLADAGWQPIAKFPGGNANDFQAMNLPGIGPVFRPNTAVPGNVKDEKQQDKLEQQYTGMMTKVLSNRSGGLGIQDAKVNQAIHLRSLLDQYYDPNTGDYNVPKSQYEEIAIGLANLLSGSNVATNSMREGIVQRTAKGDINGAISYITGSTPAASTKDVFKNLSDSINRQGLISEKLRNNYLGKMQQLAPSGLDPERIQRINGINIGNSYSDYLNSSPSYNSAAGFDPNTFMQKAKAAGYTDDQIKQYLSSKGVQQ